MPYQGFKKLAADLAAKGATTPEGLAASIGRKKYGLRKFRKHQKSGTSMQNEKPLTHFKKT